MNLHSLQIHLSIIPCVEFVPEIYDNWRRTPAMINKTYGFLRLNFQLSVSMSIEVRFICIDEASASFIFSVSAIFLSDM